MPKGNDIVKVDMEKSEKARTGSREPKTKEAVGVCKDGKPVQAVTVLDKTEPDNEVRLSDIVAQGRGMRMLNGLLE